MWINIAYLSLAGHGAEINEVIRDGYSEMSGAAISIINDSLNAKAMSEKYQGLYLRICAN